MKKIILAQFELHIVSNKRQRTKALLIYLQLHLGEEEEEKLIESLKTDESVVMNNKVYKQQKSG